MTLSTFDATMICEGVYTPENEEQAIEAWQLLIDTGTAWTLQGFFGRGAQAMIDNGYCTDAREKENSNE